MWSYISLGDDTQIAYSNIREDGTIKIDIERPVDMDFDSASCILPSYQWNNIKGFTDKEIDMLDCLLRDNAPFIFELAQKHTAKTSEVI